MQKYGKRALVLGTGAALTGLAVRSATKKAKEIDGKTTKIVKVFERFFPSKSDTNTEIDASAQKDEHVVINKDVTSLAYYYRVISGHHVNSNPLDADLTAFLCMFLLNAPKKRFDALRKCGGMVATTKEPYDYKLRVIRKIPLPDETFGYLEWIREQPRNSPKNAIKGIKKLFQGIPANVRRIYDAFKSNLLVGNKVIDIDKIP